MLSPMIIEWKEKDVRVRDRWEEGNGKEGLIRFDAAEAIQLQ